MTVSQDLRIIEGDGGPTISIGDYVFAGLTIGNTGPIIETLTPGAPNPLRCAWVPILFEGDVHDPQGRCRVVHQGEARLMGVPDDEGPSVLTNPAQAPLGTTVVFPRWQDKHHPRQIAIRWSPPYDMDEQHPWLIVGSEGPQLLAHDNIEGCEVLTAPLTEACATAELE